MGRLFLTAFLLVAVLIPSTALAFNGDCGDPFGCDANELTTPAPAEPDHPKKRKAPLRRLSVAQAKKETGRRASIEQSAWGYNGSIMFSFASKCARRSARALDCGFALYHLNNEYAPPRAAQKYCSYTVHVYLTRRGRVASTLEQRECHPMFRNG